MNHTLRIALLNAILMTGGALAWPEAAVAQTADQVYRIEAGDLDSALQQWASQSGQQLMYSGDLVAGKRSASLSGSYAPAEALRRLLDGTGLESERLNARTIVLKKAKASPVSPPPAAPKPASQASAPSERVTELPEILVSAKRSLNTDIERTRDDVQPYVIFDRQQIERSGAISVDDFLKQRLTMNTQYRSGNQEVSVAGNRSDINLRGLGANQTLILIDGRRTSGVNLLGVNLLQADLNGIPLAAVERIEVLPTTASGIYGGDATGGVINIIMRRNYQGSEVSLTWDNTFDTDSAQTRIDFATGFNLGANTNVMLTASRSEGNMLLKRDRDFVEDYRRQAYANNPGLYLPPASAPLGSLTNFRSTDGSELVLDDGTSLGSSFAHVPAGYLGAASDGGAAFLNTAGRYDLGLANTVQAGRQSLLTTPEVSSANATIRHTFTPKVEGFLELGASNNKSRFLNNPLPSTFTLLADAPTNPFQQELEVAMSLPTQDFEKIVRNTERRAVAGLIVRLPGGWLGEVDYVWHRSVSRGFNEVHWKLNSLAGAAIDDGLLDILRDPNTAPLDLTPYLIRPGQIDGPYEATTRNPTLLLGGPVGTLSGGRPMLSLRLEQRDEAFAQTTVVVPGENGATIQINPSKSQRVDSALAELRLPLFSGLNARPGLQELEVQLAARHDRYVIEGATGFIFNPTDPVTRVENRLSSSNFTVGFRWRPLEALVLRASYGTGFLPPSVNQLVPDPPNMEDSLVLDPRRGNTPVGPREILSGGNPDLQPEESKNLSFGLVLTPSFLPNLRLSVDYVRIEKDANIGDIRAEQLLAFEDRFPGRVVRGPNLPGDAAGWAGPVRSLDLSLINIARAEVEAIDVQLDWSRETTHGRFEIFSSATWQTHYKTQTFDDQPVVENVGFLFSPPKLKANLGASWRHHDWTLGWAARYFDAYRPYGSVYLQFPELIPDLLLTQGSDRVKHQIYHDLTARYEFNSDGWLGVWGEGLSLQLGIRNVFDKAPPRELDRYSYFGDPRLASYWLTLSKSF